MNPFLPADILLPQVKDLSQWAVIACDQFTSNPEYWARVREYAGDSPSAIHLILPEVELGTDYEEAHMEEIRAAMVRYQQEHVFQSYNRSFVYVERTLMSGTVRKGLVGMVDLEAYDYSVGAVSAIRATEKTVVERIPPRMRVRRGAAVELPHILMLADDHDKVLIEPIAAIKDTLPKLYDFELMEHGGRICGWLVQGEIVDQFEERLAEYVERIGEKYEGLSGVPMVFAVGDGNHSLATAKACYEEWKAANPDQDLSNHPARFALVELENIHDDAQVFEPIHRILAHTDPKKLLEDLKKSACADGGFPVRWYTAEACGAVFLDRSKGQLPVGILQSFLDQWMQTNEGEIDYIHDDDELISLASHPDSIGFLLPAMEKSQLFRGVIADGVLPRKTFSMGHAREKRYYLEGRTIR